MLWNLLLHQTDVIVYILLLIADGSSLLSWSRVSVIRSKRSTDEFTYNTYKQIPVSTRAKHFCTCDQIHNANLLFLLLQTDLSLSFYSCLFQSLDSPLLLTCSHRFYEVQFHSQSLSPLTVTNESKASSCDKSHASKWFLKKKKVQVQRAGGCGLQPADTCFSFSSRSLQNHKRLKSSFKVPLAAFGFEEQIGDKQQRNVSVVQHPQQFRM